MGMILTRRYNVDRFGYLIPHRYGNLPMVGAVATYRPGEGRFGGAVAVEEGTTNLVNLATWNPLADDQYQTVVKTQDTLLGQPIFRAVKNSSGKPPITIINLGTIAPGETYTASIWIRHAAVPVGDVSQLIFYGSATLRAALASRTDREWQRLIVTYSNNNSSPIDNVRVYFYPSRETGEVTYFAAPQVEKKPFATSFVDGSRGGGFLAFPMPVDKNTGTISLWIQPQTLYIPSGANWGGRVDLSWGKNNPNSGFVIQHYQSAIQLRIWDGVSGTSIRKSINWDVGDWIHCAIVWDSPSISFFVDGELVGALDREIDPDDRLVIGGASFGGSYNPGNALYDELLILPYAASEEEIVSWYEAQGPLPPHPQASLQWDRQTVRPAQMVKL